MHCVNCGQELKEGTSFCTECGTRVHSSTYSSESRFHIALLLSVIAIGIAIFSYIQVNNRNEQTESINREVASSVVNIHCESSTGESSGGSGTIFSESGLVLTNEHILPDEVDNESENSCLVILPDPETGSPEEIYSAHPITFPSLSEEYDIAFVKIHDVYYDHEEGRAYGEYPKEFPAYSDDGRCVDENIKLGEPIKIYGYPSVSGGYALTVTEGVVSSLFPEEGYIFTSAKISYGNSGGLAVDSSGCMIGIPSMVSADENESFGIIISTDILNQFVDEIKENEERYFNAEET